MIINYSGEPLVLYGMGNLGRKVLKQLILRGVKVIACLDRQSNESSIDGIPVYHPEKFRAGQDIIIVVCIVTVSFQKIHEELRAIGYKKIYHISNIMNNSYCLFEDYWKLSLEEVQKLDKQMISGLFFDKNSKKAYIEAVKWLHTGEEDIISRHESFGDKYWLTGIKQMFHREEVIVDCGAYDGDSITPLLSGCPDTVFSFYAFEPEGKSFRILEQKFCDKKENIHCFNFGLGKEKTVKCFWENGASSRYVPPFPGKKITTIKIEQFPLDLIMSQTAYTILKIATEGMGYEVLQGAAATIRRYRPFVIINLHHSKSDFLHVPFYMGCICKNYHFYLKLHGYCGQEIVLYAVPVERDSFQLINEEES